MAIRFTDEVDETILDETPEAITSGVSEPESTSVVGPPQEFQSKIRFTDEEPAAPVAPVEAEPTIAQRAMRAGEFLVEQIVPTARFAPELEDIGGIANAAANALDSARQSMAALNGVTPEEAQEISRLEYQKSARELSPAYSEYLEAEGMDAVKSFLKNPVEITANIAAEGLAGSVYSLGAGLATGAAGATVGSVVPVVGTTVGFIGGQVAGTFGGSLATEYGGKILEELQTAGMDLKDPESIQKFFGDEKLMESARSQALKRGVPVAIFDAVSAGIGGRIARIPFTQALTKTATREAFTEMGAQAALGGGGEVAGALAAGEEIQPKAVFGEIVGELGTGTVEIAAGKLTTKRPQTPEEKKFTETIVDTQLVTRQAQDVAPATADAVERQVNEILGETETPDERVARLQREAQEAAGEIELEEGGAGLPPVEPTPPVTPTPEAAVAPVEPVVAAEGAQPPVPTEAPAETITQAFAQMGEGAVDSYYQAVLQSLQESGEVPTPERRSNVGQAWERVRGQMTPEEFVVQLRQNAEDPSKIQAPEAAPATVEPTPVTPPPVTPQLEPLRRVARAEQTEEDVAGLVDAGFVELYNGQPVITQAGLEALPETERPRLTPEARKIQIDTRTSEAAAEAISKNLRIGVDQVPVDVRMPAGWTLVGDVYVPPTPIPKIETFDVEALAEVDEDSDVFADVIKRKDEAKAAVAQKPEGSAFATQEEFRAAFDLRGEGHGRFATRLDLMVADGVITSEGRDIIMAVIYDNNTDDTFLNNMEMGSMRARATRSYGFGGISRQTVQSAKGKAIGYKPLLKMMQNARQNLQIDEKTAQTLSTFWHEFGHAGYYSLLNQAQKDQVAAAYKKTTKAQRIKFFESGVAAARQGDVTAQYYAKSETEWFAQSFAEYVLTQKSEQKALVPIFESILNKIKGIFGKLFSRKEGTPELNDIFEYIIQGRGYGSTKIWWNGLQLSLAPAVYGTRGAQPIDPDFSRRLVEREKQNRARARMSISAPEVREARREPAITPQQDRDYLDAVERGDSGNDNLSVLLRASKAEDRPSVYQQWAERNPKSEAKLQEAVRSLATSMGYDVSGFHGSGGPILNDAFDLAMRGKNTGSPSSLLGFFFASSKNLSDWYATTATGQQQFQDAVDAQQQANEKLESISRQMFEIINNAKPLAGISENVANAARKMAWSLDKDTRTLIDNVFGKIESLQELRNQYDSIANDPVMSLPQQIVYASLQQPSQLSEILENRGITGEYLLKFENPEIVDHGGQRMGRSYSEIINKAIEDGKDGVIIRNTEDPLPSDIYIALKPEQIKSASAVTFDKAGNIIPLSQRFQPEQADIRYARREPSEIKQQYTPKTDEEQKAFDKASSNKVLARNPQLAVAAVRMKNGEITAGEYADLVDALDPFVVKGAEPIPSDDRIKQYIQSDKVGKVGFLDENGNPRLNAGDEYEFRIDINTYNRSTAAGDTVYNITAHESVPETSKRVGEAYAYVGVAKVTNPTFITRAISGKGSAIEIAIGKGKFPLATVKGNYEPITELPNDINDPNIWTEVGYNPIRSSFFVDVRSKKALVGGTEAIMVGSRVFVKNAQLEARPTGTTMGERYARRVQMGRAGMETSAVEARLQELGFPTGGIIRVVNQPDADFEGRTIILDGKVTGIELNASALKDNAAIDRVLNHEFAESANADGALNKLVERLTPKEKKEINDTITRLRYEERARTSEEAARAIETLAEAWKGRGFFTRAVARVEAWASKLGFKLTRRAAEYIAARNLADINSGFRTAYNRFINVRGEAREGRAFVTPEENARFLELAKDPEANREELQKMVDDAAKKAGFSVFDWWHGTKKDFNTFKATRYDDGLIFFSSKRDFSERWARNRKPNEKILERIESVRRESRDLVENLFKADGRFDLKREITEDTPEMREAAEKYLEAGREFERSKLDGMTWVEAEREMGVRIIHAYLRANRIFDPSKDWREVLPAILKRFGVKSESEIDKQSMDMLLKGNYIIWEEKALTDAVFEKFDAMMIQEDSDGPMNTIAVRDPSLIKMADPVTYDDQGNVIPLEQRFQTTTPDIRYARRDYQADADSYKINDLSKIRKLLNLSNIEDGIVKFLSRDLLDAKWAKIPVANDATTHGHCWVAAEAAYHILGGNGKDWEHRTLNNKGWPEGLDAGETHHFIQNKKTGEIIDPTRSQFGNVTIPYENSIFGGAFMGKTAESPSIRAKALLHRIAVGETRTEVRESRREPEAIPTFTEGTPEAATLKEMEASMAKVDAASEAKGGKPETYKISEIASVWMDSGLGERELQDAIVEYTNLTPANAARVAKAIAKQYGLQQQIAETGAVIAEIAPEPEGAPRKSAVTKLIEQTTGVRKPVVKLQVSESAALKKQIQLKAREARETRKARKEAAEELAKAITDYVKANPIRGPINSRQAMSITKKALKLDVNNEAAVDRFEMYVERVIENANYDQDLADARALIKRAKAYAKAESTQGNVKTTLEAIANVAPTLLDNPFEFNLVVQRYLLGLAPVTAKQYAVMPDADVRRYLESLETQIKDNQEILDRAKAQRILDKQAAYAEEKGIPLDEAIAILNSEEFLQEKTIEKLEDLTKLLTAMAQESQKDVKAYDDAGATPKQKELISFMRKVNLDSLINEEKKRYIRFANNLLANGATFGMEQFQSIALGQEAAMKAVKDRRLSDKLSAWISPIGGDKAIDTARRIAAKTQSEADTFKNIFGREAVGAFRNILGLNRLDVAQTDSNRAKEQIANEFGEYFKGLRKKYGDGATNFEAKGYAGIAGYLIQTDGNKTEAESIPYRRRLMEQNIVELRKSDKQADLAEADLKERALAQLTGTTNAEILSQLRALNPASYEQLMWVKDVMLPKWRDFLKEHDENFRNQANNYNNPDHLTITYKFPEGQLLPSEMEDVYQQDMIGMRIKQAANSIKRKDHPNLPVSKTGTIANIDINFGYNQYNALVDQVDKAFVAPAWEQVVAFTKAPEFEQVMGGRANALFVKNLLRDIQTSRSRQSLTDDEAQLIAGGVRLARKISTQAVLGGITQPLRQVPDQLAKLFFTTGRFDLITKNLLTTAQAAPLLNKFPIGRRGDAQAGTQYASQFSELARKVEASVTDRKWAKYRELMNKVGEFWMTPLRGSDVWAAKVSWMSYYEAELNKKGIKMESWEREAELVDTDQDRKEAASYAEFAVDFYGGASDPTKMASLSKQTNNGWKEFAKLLFLPLNSFALQQKNSLISDLRDVYLRTGDRKASIAAIAGTLAGMAAFHGMRIYIIGGLIYPAGKALLMGIFGIDMDEPDEEEKQKQLEDNWRKFKASMYGNIIAGGAGEFAEKAAIDAVNRTAYLWDANINPDSLLNEKGEIMSFRQYEKEVSPLYRFRSYGSSEYSFGLADVLTEQATHALAETQQLMTPEEMEKYTGNEQAYAAFATAIEWMYFFRLMDTDVKRIATDLKRQMDKGVEEREKELKRIREGR